jgi:hypothetical protein
MLKTASLRNLPLVITPSFEAISNQSEECTGTFSRRERKAAESLSPIFLYSARAFLSLKGAAIVDELILKKKTGL